MLAPLPTSALSTHLKLITDFSRLSPNERTAAAGCNAEQWLTAVGLCAEHIGQAAVSAHHDLETAIIGRHNLPLLAQLDQPGGLLESLFCTEIEKLAHGVLVRCPCTSRDKDLHCELNVGLGAEVKTTQVRAGNFSVNRSYILGASQAGAIKPREAFYLCLEHITSRDIMLGKRTAQRRAGGPGIERVLLGHLSVDDWKLTKSPGSQICPLKPSSRDKLSVIWQRSTGLTAL